MIDGLPLHDDNKSEEVGVSNEPKKLKPRRKRDVFERVLGMRGVQPYPEAEYENACISLVRNSMISIKRLEELSTHRNLEHFNILKSRLRLLPFVEQGYVDPMTEQFIFNIEEDEKLMIIEDRLSMIVKKYTEDTHRDQMLAREDIIDACKAELSRMRALFINYADVAGTAESMTLHPPSLTEFAQTNLPSISRI